VQRRRLIVDVEHFVEPGVELALADNGVGELCDAQQVQVVVGEVTALGDRSGELVAARSRPARLR
jgi:hypothetical protein